ncbi:MAG TPA: Ig-like domain-containing protein [Actinomycetota bacterium]|nr:Ig-like domain-containing protein [Actinomycetota bacterium]
MKKRIIAVLAVSAILLAGASLPASAARKGSAKPKKARPAVTQMKFKLSEQEVVSGEDVTGVVTVRTRSGKTWVPLAGAELVIFVDKVQIGTATTDGTGVASVSYTTEAAGDHVMKVSYAGSASHRAARRAQGFSVSEAVAPVEEPVEEPALEEPAA